MAPKRQQPPAEARDWRTLQRREYQKMYQRHRRIANKKQLDVPTRNERLIIFREILRRQLKQHRALQKAHGYDTYCGCWYPFYGPVKLYDPETLNFPKSTWKRELRKLGWLTYISYRFALNMNYDVYDPINRVMTIRIARADANNNHENH